MKLHNLIVIGLLLTTPVQAETVARIAYGSVSANHPSLKNEGAGFGVSYYPKSKYTGTLVFQADLLTHGDNWQASFGPRFNLSDNTHVVFPALTLFREELALEYGTTQREAAGITLEVGYKNVFLRGTRASTAHVFNTGPNSTIVWTYSTAIVVGYSFSF